MLQDNTDTEIIIIKDINEFIDRLKNTKMKSHEFFK